VDALRSRSDIHSGGLGFSWPAPKGFGVVLIPGRSSKTAKQEIVKQEIVKQEIVKQEIVKQEIVKQEIVKQEQRGFTWIAFVRPCLFV
jgi:hypothetical protein